MIKKKQVNIYIYVENIKCKNIKIKNRISYKLRKKKG